MFTAVMKALGCDPATALSVAAIAWAIAYAHTTDRLQAACTTAWSTRFERGPSDG